MPRMLTEEINRGRMAVALARERGMDTAEWEACLAELERQRLIAWASELAEKEVVLARPVTYYEAPLRKVTTYRISWYATQYMGTVARARFYQQYPELCWGQWTPQWWHECETEAFGALAAMFEVTEGNLKTVKPK